MRKGLWSSHHLQTEKFLGHQIHSYAQLISITFTSETPELLPDHVTLLLRGSGVTLTADLSPQTVLDPNPRLTWQQTFTVRPMLVFPSSAFTVKRSESGETGELRSGVTACGEQECNQSYSPADQLNFLPVAAPGTVFLPKKGFHWPPYNGKLAAADKNLNRQ
ncbi:hypothetical protein NQZ68_010259 [Dissostichus eleginoides]|nr:hypothetical protein NQZ68_010259 [Dissostichus eleginoides]